MGMPLKCEYQIKYNTSIHDLFIVTLSLLKGNGVRNIAKCLLFNRDLSCLLFSWNQIAEPKYYARSCHIIFFEFFDIQYMFYNIGGS